MARGLQGEFERTMNTAAVFEFPEGLTDQQRAILSAELQIARFSRIRDVPGLWVCRGKYKDLKEARHAFRNVFHTCGLGMPVSFLIPYEDFSELP